MTDATRAVALTEAVKIAGGSGAEHVLKIADAFNDFLTADTGSRLTAPAISTAGAEPAKPVKTPKAAKPATKSAPKVAEETPEDRGLAALRAQEEDEAELESDEDAPAGAKIPNSEDGVKEVIALMLARNKRKEAVALLKEFKAGSATGVKPADYAKFIAKAQVIVGPAEEAEEEADLEA